MSKGVLLLSIGASLILLSALYLLLSDTGDPGAPDRGPETQGSPDEEPDPAPEAFPPPEPSGDRSPAITGRVLGPDGDPVAGAEVCEYDVAVVCEPEGEAPEGRTATTDAEGRFTFTVKGESVHSLTARHPEQGTATLPLVRVPKDETVEVEIRLQIAAISGTVVGVDGSPIPGARISTDSGAPLRVLYRCLARWWYRPKAEVAALTGEDGTFRLGPLLPGTFDLGVEAQGHAKSEYGSATAPSEGLVIRLEPGGAIQGVVKIVGEPLPEELKLLVWGHGSEVTIPVEGPDTSFRLSGFPPGEYELLVWAAGFTEAGATASVGRGRDSEPVRVELFPGTRVSGLVVEKETGKPVPDAEVGLWRPWKASRGHSWNREILTRTDGGGRYECRLRPGKWGVAAAKTGFFPMNFDEVVIEVGKAPVERNLALAPIPASITGLVRYADGAPVPGATVAVIGVGSNEDRDDSGTISHGMDMQTETGPDGRFRLVENIVPWCTYDLRATGPGQASAVVRDVKFDPGVSELDVEFELERVEETGGRVEGRVVDEEGRPVSGALVVCARRLVVTGRDGRFVRDKVPPGTYRPTFGRIGFAQGFAKPIEVRSGQTVLLPDLVLKRDGVVVRGTVRDREDRPMAGARIAGWFWPEGRASFLLQTHTRDDGTYYLEGPDVAGTPLTVQVGGRPIRHQARETTAEKEVVVDFVVDRYSVVVGRLSADGPTPEEIRMFSNGHGHFQFYDVERDPDTGAFRIHLVEPGRHRVSFRAKGYAPNEFREIEVPDGGEFDIGAVRLTKGGTLEGRVLDAKGRPIAGVQVSVSNEFIFTDTDEDGRYRLTGLPTRKLTLYINGLKDREESPAFEVQVKDGETVTRDLLVPK